MLLERLENYPMAQVAAGDQFSLAVTRWGGLFAWGDNRRGQLGETGCRWRGGGKRIVGAESVVTENLVHREQ